MEQDKELFQLCKDVYERTGWETERSYWSDTRNPNNYIPALREMKIIDWKPKWLHRKDNDDNHIVPLYNSDYLLDKLPEVVIARDYIPGEWRAGTYGWYIHDWLDYADSDTPLKALLKLTIALSDAGELK